MADATAIQWATRYRYIDLTVAIAFGLADRYGWPCEDIEEVEL